MNATVMNGEVHTTDTFKWTHAGSNNESMIAFPLLSADNAGTELDKIMAYYVRRPTKGIGCWSLDPTQPADLGVRLLARGFQPGWRPQWMALDLDNIYTDSTVPHGLEIRADNTTPIYKVDKLPYASLGESGVNQSVLNAFPENTQRFLAILNGQVVAQSAVLFAAGVAGIYNVGVVPHERNQGIGEAIVLAISTYAREKGYHYAVLNATGRRMYEKAGFKWLGDGWTWWLKTSNLTRNPPTPSLIAFAEAIGTGDVSSLQEPIPEELLTNGMTFMQFAVHCKQPAAAEWLIAHGVPYSVLDAWDLGWKDRAASLLRQDPSQVNQQYGDGANTLLHLAVVRNDLELATLALSANPDPDARDYIYNSTPADWARHLRHQEMLELIMSSQQ